MEYRLTYQQYQKGLEEGKLLGLVCNACNTITCPPLGVCRKCGSPDQSKTQVTGRGTIRTFTVVRVAPEGRKPPYVVAMVELEQGPWVMGNVVGIGPQEADMGLIGRDVRVGTQQVACDPSPQGTVWSLTFSLI